MPPFIDTSVLVYFVDADEPEKQEISRRLVREHLAEGAGTTSVQVLREFFWSSRRLRTPVSHETASEAVEYLAKEEKVERWVLAGTDYVYPRTTNKILEAYLLAKGVKPADIMINYTPFGHADWQTIVADIKKFGSAGKKTAVVSTINGDANVPFYKELANQGVKATDIPVVAFSVV